MDYQDFNDYELIYLVEEDNEDALQLLFKKYQPFINKIVLRFYYSLKKYGVEYDDIYQEAYLAFMKAVRLFDNRENTLFYTFLNISIRSRLLNYRRVIMSKKNSFYSNMISLNANVFEDDDLTFEEYIEDKKQVDPVLLLDSRNLENQLKSFSLELSPIQGQIFELVYNGFENYEIAILLDMEGKEVSNYLYRIRKRLKNYLAS